MDQDKICQNCSCFVQDNNDFKEWFGICVNDKAFEPFIDEILENADFSGCYDLYLEKRFSGEKEACEDFEDIEELEAFESEEEYNWYIIGEKYKNANVSELLNYLENPNIDMRTKAVNELLVFIVHDNKDAYDGLIDYYMGLQPADNLEEVHFRMEIIEVLHRKISEQKTINAYINELARTPSNNTTRQLYSKILQHLEKAPAELTRDPLLELLEKRQYAYKMKNRIIDIIDMKHKSWYHTW